MTFVQLGYDILKFVFGALVLNEIIIPLSQSMDPVSDISLKEVPSLPPHFFKKKVISNIFVKSKVLGNVPFS